MAHWKCTTNWSKFVPNHSKSSCKAAILGEFCKSSRVIKMKTCNWRLATDFFSSHQQDQLYNYTAEQESEGLPCKLLNFCVQHHDTAWGTWILEEFRKFWELSELKMSLHITCCGVSMDGQKSHNTDISTEQTCYTEVWTVYYFQYCISCKQW